MVKRFAVITLLAVLALALATPAGAQRITGSVAGTVTDPSGAVLSSAVVTLTDPSHGYKAQQKANQLGKFEFTDLTPGSYKVAVEASGFVTYVEMVTVRVNMVAPVDARMKVGAAATELTVEGAAENIDPIRSTVQGIVSGGVIDSLPLNGRNFLDLAQQQPGVQVVDGGNFDPTKNGMVGVSVGGRSGRVTRTQVDGVDITDETVGTTVMNISNESIQEFNIAQSNLDPSTDITSSGAVNIITRSGSNSFHGSGFFLFRDSAIAADQRIDKTAPTTAKPPYRRKLMGGRAGGPFIKNKWFWHVEYERNQTASQTFTQIPQDSVTGQSYFPQFNGAWKSPFNERMAGARTDFNVSDKLKLFYRINHNWNKGVTGFGGTGLQAFANLNRTNSHVAGADFASGHFTHQVRFSYVDFNNFIVDSNADAGLPNSITPLAWVQAYISGVITYGPNYLAPQATLQRNKQFKYDGSYLHGRHTFRFGAEFNKIAEGGFANFYGNGPRVYSTTSRFTTATCANQTPVSLKGCDELPAHWQTGYTLFNAATGLTDPLNWPFYQARIGNGLGFFSEQPGIGLPHGALFNNRWGIYGQDTVQVTRNLNVNFGLRWTMNTGYSDHDLERASAVSLFDQQLGGYPTRPSADFSPSAGFAWNVHGDGKTVIRGGAGIYYETNLFNSTMFDRPVNIAPGLGNDRIYYNSSNSKVLDPGTGAVLFNFATQCTALPGGNCFSSSPYPSIGAVLPYVIQASNALKAASAALAAGWPGTTPPYFNIQMGTGSNTLIYPQYKTPYGVQMNIGFQREIKHGLVLTADYVRNHGVHFNTQINANRIGAADTLDVSAAATAIADTLADCGVATIAAGYTTGCPAGNAGGFKAGHKLTIADFAGYGLGSGYGMDGMAFHGKNPNFRDIYVAIPAGLSTFQALQVALRGDLGSWGSVLKKVQSTINYQFGRYDTSLADQDFVSSAAYNDRPTKFYGPGGYDRTHQFGFSFMVDFPWQIHFNTSTAIRSSRASSLFVPTVTGGADEIFYTDFDGDGVTNDPLLGTNRGAFGRSVNASNINNYIDKYNATVAGQLTPAGLALVNAGLFTSDQLKALKAVAPTINPAPAGQLDNPLFLNTDLRISKTVKVWESLNFEPMMEIFNVFNRANYGAMGTDLSGTTGAANGTTSYLKVGNRAGFGSGAFSPGTQRAFQFGVRVNW